MTAIVAFIISHELPDWNGHQKLPSILTKKSHWNRKRKNCNFLTWLLSKNHKIYVWFFNTFRNIWCFMNFLLYDFMPSRYYKWIIQTTLFILILDSFCHNSYCFDCYIFFLSCAISRNLQSVKGTQNYLLRALVGKEIKKNFST